MDVSFQKNSLLVPGDNIIGITIPGKGITIYHAKDEGLHRHENNPERWLRLQWKKEIDVNKKNIYTNSYKYTKSTYRSRSNLTR